MMVEDIKELKQAVKKNCVLQSYPDELVKELESVASPILYAKNSHIDISADSISYVFILAKGIALEIINNESGDERAVDILKPGRVVGACEAITEAQLNVHLKTISDCKFIKIPSRYYLSFIEKKSLIQQVLRCNQLRAEKFKKHLAALQLSSHEKKIAWAIEQLKNEDTNKLVARNIDIAIVVGCSKETVSRVISNMGNVTSQPKKSSKLA
jgi:CRP-like cAMP-binding protein